MKEFQVITALPQNFQKGSGCYVGTRTLVEGMRRLGNRVSFVTPSLLTPVFAVTRMLFNEQLRWRRFECDATIGIDADGYTIARRKSPPHIACIKGVMADTLPYEKGVTWASMALQSQLEKRHAEAADLIVTTSQYCVKRLREIYNLSHDRVAVVPELIDLAAWQQLFQANPRAPNPHTFTVLSVCRFYPRKRLDVLLRAASMLRGRISNLEVRIVGNGPEAPRLRALADELDLGSAVQWVGDASNSELAREYSAADIFCHPSVQEGFGIVFLEAMAAGKPIVAAHAAAAPEVVQNGLLVEPDNPEALADGIFTLYRDESLRSDLAAKGKIDVERFEMSRVAKQFLDEVAKKLT